MAGSLFNRKIYRNIFSDILRVCPTDGIARWYLFACEHFFQSGSDEAAFQLFGTDDQQH